MMMLPDSTTVPNVQEFASFPFSPQTGCLRQGLYRANHGVDWRLPILFLDSQMHAEARVGSPKTRMSEKCRVKCPLDKKI